MQNQTPVYLYFLNLYTGEKIEIAKSITKGFSPKWISNKIIEYNDPDGFIRLTFNIDDYYLNKAKEMVILSNNDLFPLNGEHQFLKLKMVEWQRI